ncbi:MAG: hypothetical protein FOGNACKC_02048 [Anaerolineae bacterium]|nr:hypothetical protein [Anaerolineae bacterium]
MQPSTKKLLLALVLGVVMVGLFFVPFAAAPASDKSAAEVPTQPAASTATPVPPTPTQTPATTPAAAPSPRLTPAPALQPLTVYTYTVVNTFPHDRNGFTQGLIYLDGIFYEGTGLTGRSTLRKVDVETGSVLQMINLPAELFGEGITVLGNRLYQLTWKAGRGFVYNKDTFEIIQEFSYPTEGWGITHDGRRLIMSDGSDTLYFWDPDTLQEIGRVHVFDQRGPVVRLNELEYINGEVFANVWQTSTIARINPETGQVTGWILLDGLLTPADLTEPVDVLNGIAYDAATDRLFITGKFWPKVFEIKLAPLTR